jgi:hypothetical protein
MQAVKLRGASLCVIVAAACSDPAPRVALVPVGGGACGRPTDATALTVTAFGSAGEVTRAVALDETISLDDFPADTLAIGVTVLGSGGAVAAIGKTAPLAFDSLADGADIPIFMAPPDGACSLPDLGTPRAGPLVALAADGVLIVGGVGSTGPLSTAERYDPATATFSTVTIPDELVDPDNGLQGGVLTSLPGGGVVLTGTSRGILSMYDPVKHAFLAPSVIDRRALHAAIALDGDHLLVAGGCADLVAGACSGVALRSTLVYTLSDLSHVGGPVLADGDPRVNGALVDLGPRVADGADELAYTSPDGRLARFAVTDANADELDGLGGQIVALDGGALLAAYGSGSSATVIAPSASVATPVATPPPADTGARLIALQDGRALAIGGTADGSVATYDPTLDAWSSAAAPGDPLGVLAAPTLLRLADGSVLVLASPATADDPSHAWIYRPSLTGPEAGSVVALPDGSTGGVLTAPDPSLVARTPGELVLTAPGRVLVGGPRLATGSVQAVVRPTGGGAQLIAQQTGPGRALVGTAIPGQPAAITRVDAAHVGVACTGGSVAPFGVNATTLGLAVRDGIATLTRDGSILVTCELDVDPDVDDVGAWGLAAAGSGGTVDVVTVTVSR